MIGDELERCRVKRTDHRVRCGQQCGLQCGRQTPIGRVGSLGERNHKVAATHEVAPSDAQCVPLDPRPETCTVRTARGARYRRRWRRDGQYVLYKGTVHVNDVYVGVEDPRLVDRDVRFHRVVQRLESCHCSVAVSLCDRSRV